MQHFQAFTKYPLQSAAFFQSRVANEYCEGHSEECRGDSGQLPEVPLQNNEKDRGKHADEKRGNVEVGQTRRCEADNSEKGGPLRDLNIDPEHLAELIQNNVKGGGDDIARYYGAGDVLDEICYSTNGAKNEECTHHCDKERQHDKFLRL